MLSFFRPVYYHDSFTHFFKNICWRLTMHQALCQVLEIEQYTRIKSFALLELVIFTGNWDMEQETTLISEAQCYKRRAADVRDILISNLVWWKSGRPPWRSDVLLEIGRMLGVRIGKGRWCLRARGKKSIGLLRQGKKCSLVRGWNARKRVLKGEIRTVPRDQVTSNIKNHVKICVALS